MTTSPPHHQDVELVAVSGLNLPAALQTTIAKWCDSIGVKVTDAAGREIKEEALIRHHFAGQCILRLHLSDGLYVFPAGQAEEDAAIELAAELCDEFIEQQTDCRIQFPQSIAD